jgi:diguanylate cyclase (GGDEF)-like protein
VRISLALALPEVHVFDSLDPDSLSFRLPPDIKIDTPDLVDYADYLAPDPTGIRTLLQAVNANTTQLILINLVIFAICAFTINILVARPLRRFETMVESLNSGEPFTGGLPTGLRIRELDRLRDSLLGYHAKLTQLHADLDQKNSELWQLAHVDVLTGVGNRLAFEQEWKRLVDELSGSDRQITFMMFDLDQLKAINDKYGHDVGDSAIKTVAASLQQALKETDQLYRLGGDEFATTLIDVDQATGERLAARCLEAVNQIETGEMGIEEPLKISIGLARSAATDEAALDELPRLADEAMYRAKYSNDPKLKVHDIG